MAQNTPNLGLVLPDPTGDQEQINQALINAFVNVDSHNHGDAHGLRVPSNRVIFDDDMDANNRSINDAKSVELKDQEEVTTITQGSLYRRGNDLYFRDGRGADVKLTHDGGINNVIVDFDTGQATSLYYGWSSGYDAESVSGHDDAFKRNLINRFNATSGTLKRLNNFYVGGLLELTLSAPLADNSFYYLMVAIKDADNSHLQAYLGNFENDSSNWLKGGNTQIQDDSGNVTYNRIIRTIPYEVTPDDRIRQIHFKRYRNGPDALGQ